jgi:TM2 domain-containing membrane protein YozV
VAKKTAAGVCGVLFGGLGVHKFILGKTSAGLLMLLVNLTCTTVGIVGGMLCIFPFVFIFGSTAMGVIGLIEGILYLTRSDEAFYEMYRVQGREWF